MSAKPVETARSARNARTTNSALCPVSKTRPYWTECRPASRKVRPDIFDQRRETAEHPFGTIKQWMNQGAFLMRGLEKVRAEFRLTALAYNLRRVLNIVGLPKLIAAVPA
jgi:hypothetical protein